MTCQGTFQKSAAHQRWGERQYSFIRKTLFLWWPWRQFTNEFKETFHVDRVKFGFSSGLRTLHSRRVWTTICDHKILFINYLTLLLVSVWLLVFSSIRSTTPPPRSPPHSPALTEDLLDDEPSATEVLIVNQETGKLVPRLEGKYSAFHQQNGFLE